jgi:hypothetical protein
VVLAGSAFPENAAPFSPTPQLVRVGYWVGLKGAASYANPGEASTHWSVVRETASLGITKISDFRTTASRGSVAGWGFLAVRDTDTAQFNATVQFGTGN